MRRDLKTLIFSRRLPVTRLQHLQPETFLILFNSTLQPQIPSIRSASFAQHSSYTRAVCKPLHQRRACWRQKSPQTNGGKLCEWQTCRATDREVVAELVARLQGKHHPGQMSRDLPENEFANPKPQCVLRTNNILPETRGTIGKFKNQGNFV